MVDRLYSMVLGHGFHENKWCFIRKRLHAMCTTACKHQRNLEYTFSFTVTCVVTFSKCSNAVWCSSQITFPRLVALPSPPLLLEVLPVHGAHLPLLPRITLSGWEWPSPEMPEASGGLTWAHLSSGAATVHGDPCRLQASL